MWLVVGTRPEAIKLAPVARALTGRVTSTQLIVTGQHSDLDLASHGLGSLPSVHLACPGSPDPDLHVHSVAAALLRLLAAARPALIIVQGDTSSALGGALAGFAAGVPVAHVEAGLRTFDPRAPWPEEMYRSAIDARAELLFAPTDVAAANLKREGVAGAIVVTGNTGIDALLSNPASAKALPLRESLVPRLLVGCHRRENWGTGLRSIAEALRRIAGDGSAAVDVLLHPNRHLSAEIRRLLGREPNVDLIGPCSHSELIERMRSCDLMLSDSGGVQEEAPALGVPLLVLRDKTERPEALDTGNMLLVGTDAGQVEATVRRLLADPVARARMAKPALPFGDGFAAPRIAQVIAEWLLDRQGAGVVTSGLGGMADRDLPPQWT